MIVLLVYFFTWADGATWRLLFFLFLPVSFFDKLFYRNHLNTKHKIDDPFVYLSMNNLLFRRAHCVFLLR